MLPGDLLNAYSDATLTQLLQDKYDAIPVLRRSAASAGIDDTSPITRQMLVQFYTKHDAKSVSRVDEILLAYSAADLRRALSKKYGNRAVIVQL